MGASNEAALGRNVQNERELGKVVGGVFGEGSVIDGAGPSPRTADIEGHLDQRAAGPAV